MPERVHRITSMGGGAPHEAQATDQPNARTDEPVGVERVIDRVLAIQRPLVVAHLRSLRRRFPDASPDRLVRILELRYLAAVTTGGAAVGATAVVPGVGTGVTLALSGIETAGFLEATALFAQSITEVHGIPVENPDRARALVMTLMLGNEGIELVKQFAGQAVGGGPARNVYWGELVTNTLPKAVMGTIVDRLRTTFVKQFAVRGGVGFFGKALPFGIGAAIGGIGNQVLGRRVVQQSRSAFGSAPPVLPFDLEPRHGDPVLQSVGLRLARAGAAAGGAVGSMVGTAVGGAATATGRGIRSLGSNATRVMRRRPATGGASDPTEPAATDEPTGAPDPAPAPQPPTGD